MGNLRQLVLSNFKKLHRTRLKVFDGDERALGAARLKINEEYHKNKHVTDEESIKAMIEYGESVEKELRTTVIQAREVRPGVYAAKISEDTLKLDNVPYKEMAVPDEGGKNGSSCCQNQSKT